MNLPWKNSNKINNSLLKVVKNSRAIMKLLNSKKVILIKSNNKYWVTKKVNEVKFYRFAKNQITYNYKIRIYSNNKKMQINNNKNQIKSV